MAKTIIEFELKGREYLVTRNHEWDYDLKVNKVSEPGILTADDVIRRLGWMLHDESVTIKNLEELSKI